MSWNTSWNCSADRIVRQVDAVGALDPDVAFFSEWSPVSSRTTTSGKTISNSHHVRTEQLDAAGLSQQVHEHASDYAGRTDGQWARQHWGILAASRQPIHKVPVDNPTFAPGTWLEIQHESTGMTLVSVRMPAWDGPQIHRRREFWEWMLEQFERLGATPAIVLGDFNTETSYRSERTARAHGADLIRAVTADLSWTDAAVAAGQATPTFARKDGRTARLDYVFTSPALCSSAIGFSAPTTVGQHHLVGEKASGPLSDHTPVVVDVNPVPIAVH